MGWARLDDGFHDHPKIDGLSLAAVGLYTLCLTWAHRHRRTAIAPGHVTVARVRKVAGRQLTQLSSELVSANLWEVCTDSVHGGWMIHDFSEYVGGEIGWAYLSRVSEKAQREAQRAKDRRTWRGSVFERDAHRCTQCGATEDLTLDHIVPLRANGAARLSASDFATLCRTCNSRKGATLS